MKSPSLWMMERVHPQIMALQSPRHSFFSIFWSMKQLIQSRLLLWSGPPAQVTEGNYHSSPHLRQGGDVFTPGDRPRTTSSQWKLPAAISDPETWIIISISLSLTLVEKCWLLTGGSSAVWRRSVVDDNARTRVPAFSEISLMDVKHARKRVTSQTMGQYRDQCGGSGATAESQCNCVSGFFNSRFPKNRFSLFSWQGWSQKCKVELLSDRNRGLEVFPNVSGGACSQMLLRTFCRRGAPCEDHDVYRTHSFHLPHVR